MAIRCGHCGDQHATVADVLACSEIRGEIAATKGYLGIREEARPMPTQKQLDFAHALLRQNEPYGLVADAEYTNSIDAAHEYISGMDKDAIGDFIGQMKRQPKRAKTSKAVRPADVRVGEGIYRMDEDIYKVQVAHHGSGHLYAKRLVHAEGRGHFMREPGALGKLWPHHMLTISEAAQFGRLYGFCVKCGRILTDEGSIAAGIGPVCANKSDWFA